MIYHAVDPGPEMSGYVQYSNSQRRVLWAEIYPTADLLKSMRAGLMHDDCIAIEDIEARGTPMGHDLLETVRIVGQMQEIMRTRAPIMLTRSEVKVALCGSTRAKDGNVSAVIRSLFVKWYGLASERATRGSKKNPGPLYEVRSHCWAALAVAIVAAHGDDVHLLEELK